MQVVSATTKRRLLIKSLAQLKQGKQSIQVCRLAFKHLLTCTRLLNLSNKTCHWNNNFLQLLTEHLRALQAASQQWQRTMMYASRRYALLTTTQCIKFTGQFLFDCGGVWMLCFFVNVYVPDLSDDYACVCVCFCVYELAHVHAHASCLWWSMPSPEPLGFLASRNPCAATRSWWSSWRTQIATCTWPASACARWRRSAWPPCGRRRAWGCSCSRWSWSAKPCRQLQSSGECGSLLLVLLQILLLVQALLWMYLCVQTRVPTTSYYQPMMVAVAATV